MPGIVSVIQKFANQNALYWAKIGSDKGGRPTYGDPVVIQVRWEDDPQEVEMSEGRRVDYKNYILTAYPIKVGDYVFLGNGVDPLSDWEALPNYPDLPTVGQGGREMMKVKKTPDLKASSFVYEGLCG